MPLGKLKDRQSKLHAKQTVKISVNFYVNGSSEYIHSFITDCFLRPALGWVLKLEQDRENTCPPPKKTYNLVGDLENKMINYNILK